MGKPTLTIFYQFNPWQFTNWWYSKTVLRQLVPMSKLGRAGILALES